MNDNEALTIASTILAQLGDEQFICMTGANNFIVGKDGSLKFRFKGSRKFNALKITLNIMDTYDLEFLKISKLSTGLFHCENEKKIEGIYNDDLQRIFTAETGLYCTAGAVIKSKLTKIAVVKDPQTGKLYLNCRCGSKPETDLETKEDVKCQCGKMFTYNGWIINQEKEECDEKRVHDNRE